MDDRSIEAYTAPQRVTRYDADMDLMHPNRAKMVRIALDVLPFAAKRPLRALDLGIGTGYFTQCFVERFPMSSVLGVDGAGAMAELARTRLGPRADRVELRIGDFRQLASVVPDSEGFDVAYSSFALHHLNRDEKRAVVRHAVQLLRPGGWFLNADIIGSDFAVIDRKIQELRAAGIVERAGGQDPRFHDVASTRRFLDEMEEREGDQPQTLASDLETFRAAGVDASVLWLEHREVVCGGPIGAR